MPSLRGAALATFVLCAGTACRSHDPARELSVSGVETYWIVDSPQQGQNYVAPAVRFRLKNVSSETLGSVQARARFPAPDQREAWGSIQEQVSTWSRPLDAGKEAVVTVRSAGRYHAPADPEEMLRSPAFKDPRVEVFVRIGSSNWAMMAEAPVVRRIGAPETLDLSAGR
ncbi:MAG TPA: hypothetical protein VLF95_03385 [Vicinamibacteria bacterium]|nr:hypothetical protein [Vicinamibacteria bacterium]